MKKRILVTLGLTVALLGSMYVYASPATIYSDLAGVTEEEAYELRKESDKNFGQLAEEAGKLEEFRAEMIKEKTEWILKGVEDGKITQEKADEIIANMKERINNCDPSNPEKPRIGRENGLFRGKGEGFGCGMRGTGQGRGQGRGYKSF
jgi:hypothetical protein